MKVIAYLGFTLLSIVIQFCVMDFIQEIQLEGPNDINVTSRKVRLSDILKNLTDKPHALYYRTDKLPLKNNAPSKIIFSNSSLQNGMLDTTTLSSTIFDVLYDENVSDSVSTTESMFTTTQIDNVTEITFFEPKNKTNTKPKIIPKKNPKMDKKCSCNLLYKVCDINCCCDNDCSEEDRKLFVNCNENISTVNQDERHCYPHLPYSIGQFDFLCIAKSNLPEKRNTNLEKYDLSYITKAKDKAFVWLNSKKHEHIKFLKNPYVYGDVLWTMKNGTLYQIDMPFARYNSYCSSRSPIRFLKDQKFTCLVKLQDLEMLKLLKKTEETTVISTNENFYDNTALNCSTLFCADWTVIICNETACTNYNKYLHEPSCTEAFCTHVAIKIDYIFHFYNSSIHNATIKMYTEKVPIAQPLITQEISVKFLLTNESDNRVVKLSGSTGYITGLPVIASVAETNHTEFFYNATITTKEKWLSYLKNKNGLCLTASNQENYILFGQNTKNKCRYIYEGIIGVHNTSDACKKIQQSIDQLLGLNKKTVISPYGNPYYVSDDKWVPLLSDRNTVQKVYGEYLAQNSKLVCRNVISGLSIVFTFADTSAVVSRREYKLLSANLNVHIRNVSFDVEDVSMVVTS